MKIKKAIKKFLREWGIILGIFALLYATGLHTEVIGKMQQVILWTGLIQPDTQIPENEIQRADYSYSLISLEGERARLEDFRGKVIFVNFWATWCAPCIAEMPNIQSLYEDLRSRDDIVFVMISLDDSMDKAREFIRRKAFTFPVYMQAGRRPPVFRSTVIPTTFVIDKRGNIVSKKQGMANYNTSRFREFLLNLTGGDNGY